MNTVDVLGVPIAALNLDSAADQVEAWIRQRARTYVTATGVHGVMESQRDEAVRAAHRAAGMCCPDGMPMVWIGRARGHSAMGRVYGPDLMMEMMARSQATGYTHFLYGGKEGVAERLKERMEARFPGVRIIGTYAPPFRPLTRDEEVALADEIGRLKPDLLWVGLSTPKQELWMHAHSGALDCAVMLGVGAAFDMHAGLLRQAPRWMQRHGLEWIFRLAIEPRRLWRRYLYNNPMFVLLLTRDWVRRGILRH